MMKYGQYASISDIQPDLDKNAQGYQVERCPIITNNGLIGVFNDL